MRAGERQVAPELSGIRRDHVARYQWAAQTLPIGLVIDFGCGIGYGSHVLAEHGQRVLAADVDPEALAYAKRHYSHERVSYDRQDASHPDIGEMAADAAVCFEVIEHVRDPLPLLKALRSSTPKLLASVPNEEVFPYNNHAYHFRHYTRRQFENLLRRAGWRVTEWWGQAGPESEVERDCNGRTLIAVAEHCEPVDAVEPIIPRPAPALPVPRHVAILGLGPSVNQYLEISKRLGGRRKYADETWAINALGDVFACDRVFHMDDVRIQGIRAAARPESNIAAMLAWLKCHPGPIYTSRSHPDYPGLVDYPLAEVAESTGKIYFNSTAAYAVALAVHIGVERISVFGNDFTYPNSHDAEKGRGCVEFWLGFAAARGIQITIPRNSSLLDAMVKSDQRLYGYDTVSVSTSTGDDGALRVDMQPRDELPTADEIEARYDHSAHPNPLVSGR